MKLAILASLLAAVLLWLALRRPAGPLRCNVCGATFWERKAAVAHVRSVHGFSAPDGWD